jgi:thymidylate synthase
LLPNIKEIDVNITAQNSTFALVSALQLILDSDEVPSRAGATKEICGINITITNPLERCFVLPHRNDNIFAKIAETLWVLYGRNDIEWLSYYLPRAKDFSDDGLTWRAGYGPRLRYAGNKEGLTIDPLLEVATMLEEDPNTRRAVISLWDNQLDYCPSLDIPCNNWLHFMIRNGMLNMYVAQRSCDAIWGFSGINAFEWSVLMQMMAYWTHTEVGTLNYTISSMHVYEHHYKKAEAILKSFNGQTIYDYGVLPAGGFKTGATFLDTALCYMFEVEENTRKVPKMPRVILDDDFLNNCTAMLQIYIYSKSCDMKLTTLRSYIMDLPDNDFKMAAIEYFHRTISNVIFEEDMEDWEEWSYLAPIGKSLGW